MTVEGSIEEQPTIVICDVRPETFVACARAVSRFLFHAQSELGELNPTRLSISL
jgi:hypothetical protein